mmetsp:Transcript_41255/g.68637  ORF Transcript_41255/g.68637 Transcript_41255/m.68637 type:complete len:590 (-) Transcript_41255:378-2147(-)
MPPPTHYRVGVFVLLPALSSVGGHLGFLILLLDKWQAIEVATGGPLNSSNLTALPRDNLAAGYSWPIIFLPLWVAECMIASMAVLALCSRSVASRNTNLLHANTVCQAFFNALFKIILAKQLGSPLNHISWLMIFSPLYLAMLLQVYLHFWKEPDGRGRRPGFPFALAHLLALLVSLKLENALHYGDSTWASVFWPLWAIGGFLGCTLMVGVCCGVPLLLRREMQTQMTLFLAAVLLLMLSIFVPGVLAAVRLTEWLDGTAPVTAAQILVPYLTATALVLLILVIALVFVLLSPRGVRRAVGTEDDADDEPEPTIAAADLPKLLFRESSTFFVSVTSSQYEKHMRRKTSCRLVDDPESGVDISMIEEGAPTGTTAASAGDDKALPLYRSVRSQLDSDAAPEAAPTATSGSHPTSATALSGGRARAVLPLSDTGGRQPCDEWLAPKATSATDAENESGSESGAVCWICAEGPPDAVILTCGHGGLCYSCAMKCWRQKSRQCPMCRDRIKHVARVSATADDPDIFELESDLPARTDDNEEINVGLSSTNSAEDSQGVEPDDGAHPHSSSDAVAPAATPPSRLSLPQLPSPN